MCLFDTLSPELSSFLPSFAFVIPKIYISSPSSLPFIPRNWLDVFTCAFLSTMIQRIPTLSLLRAKKHPKIIRIHQIIASCDERLSNFFCLVLSNYVLGSARNMCVWIENLINFPFLEVNTVCIVFRWPAVPVIYTFSTPLYSIYITHIRIKLEQWQKPNLFSISHVTYSVSAHAKI